MSDKPAQVLTGLHGHGQKPFGTQPSQSWPYTHSKGDPSPALLVSQSAL